jgi:hypothetical protein
MHLQTALLVKKYLSVVLPQHFRCPSAILFFLSVFESARKTLKSILSPPSSHRPLPCSLVRASAYNTTKEDSAMQHVQKMDPLTGHQLPVAPLSVTTIHLSPWERLSTRIKETGRGETITEIVLATVTFSLVGGLLFSLYRALEQYTIIPLP